MLILGIETATDRVGAALVDHVGVLAETHLLGGRRHAEALGPTIEFLMAQADRRPQDLAAIAVDVGPGLFTGLRVGLAHGKAMAHALAIPMLGVPSLDLVAFPLRYGDKRVVSVIDARRGEVYWATYWPVPGGVQREGEHRIGAPEQLVSELTADPADTLLVGDGAPLRQRFRWHRSRGICRSCPVSAFGLIVGAVGAPPGDARGVCGSTRNRAPLPSQAGRRDQLGHAQRPGVVGTATMTRPVSTSSAVTPVC